jgi:hypothetical protein
MKQTRLQSTLIAAMMTLAASAAFGQDDPMTTKIPFAFRAVGSDLPAGSYMLSTTREGSRTVALVNQDTGKKVFIPSSAPISESKGERPRLVFTCGGEEGCSLARLWSGTGRGMEFPTPKLTANQRERRETIYLDRFKEK